MILVLKTITICVKSMELNYHSYIFLKILLFDLLNNVDTHKRVFKRADNISKNFDDGVFYMASFNSVIKNLESNL